MQFKAVLHFVNKSFTFLVDRKKNSLANLNKEVWRRAVITIVRRGGNEGAGDSVHYCQSSPDNIWNNIPWPGSHSVP